MEDSGVKFLIGNDPNIQESKEVRFNSAQQDLLGSTPEEQVASWLQTIENTHMGHREDPVIEEKVEGRIKDYYHKRFVIEEENVPESYFENQQRVAREQGHGYIPITDNLRKQGIDSIQRDQQSSLDIWIDYLTSEDSSYLPMWFKFWAFKGATELGRYNKVAESFEPRLKDTVAPFPELNQEALGNVFEILKNKYSEKYFELTDTIFNRGIDLKNIERAEKVQKLLKLVDEQYGENEIKGKVLLVTEEDGNKKAIRKKDLLPMKESLLLAKGLNREETEEELALSKSKRGELLREKNIPEIFFNEASEEVFGNLYSYAINKLTPTSQLEKETVQGEWIKYEQGSDHMRLYDSLQGKGTGWCTAAGMDTAKIQLDRGDFYVYYSYDSNGAPVNPRIAIRMNGKDEIAEVRGVDANQDIDPQILNSGVLEEKFKEFGNEGERYLSRVEDMKFVTEIEKKSRKGEPFSKEEILFIYEITGEIQGFSHRKDPRINEILQKRNAKEDLAYAFGVKEEQIRLKDEGYDIFEDTGVYYYEGGISLEEVDPEKELFFPKIVKGWVNLKGDRMNKNIILPEKILSDLRMSFKEVIDIKFPYSVSGFVDVRNLKSARDITLPSDSCKKFNFYQLEKARNIIFTSGSVDEVSFGSLKEAEKILLPRKVDDSVDLGSLLRVKEIVLPEEVGMSFSLHILSYDGKLVSPKKIGIDFKLDGLQSCKGCSLPEMVGGTMDVSNLRKVENTSFPSYVGGDLSMPYVEILKNVVLPRYVGGHIHFDDLESSDNVTYPEEIGGEVFIKSYRSYDTLPFPQHIYEHLSIRSHW